MQRPPVQIKSAHITNSQTATKKSLVVLAQTIWKEVKTSGVNPADNSGNSKLLKELQKKYRDFAVTFPIVLRWMVQIREFHPKPFNRYITKYFRPHYKDRKAFMAAQGEYLILLYKHNHPRAAGDEVTRYRETVMKSIEQDDEVFMTAHKNVEAEVKKLDAAVDMDRRRRLYEFLTRRKAAKGTDGVA